MKTKIYTILAALLALHLSATTLFAQDGVRDGVIFSAMEDELQRNMKELSLPGHDKPFFLSYTMKVADNFDIKASLGAIVRPYVMYNTAEVGVTLLLGDYHRTSYSNIQKGSMPLEADYDIIRRTLWLTTDAAYKRALQELAKKQAYLKANPKTPEEEELDDLCKIEAVTKVIDNPDFQLDKKVWEDNIRELSAIFNNYKDLFDTQVYIRGLKVDIYKKTSEGTMVKQPMNEVSVYAKASTRTGDDILLTKGKSWVAAAPKNLPSLEELKKQLTRFADDLMNLRKAQPVEEFYSGPVLFEEVSCAQIFMDNLLSQEALYAFKRPDGATTFLKTFEERIGKKVIDSRVTVKNYTNLKKYNNTPLMGAYEVDAEGVIPEKEMTLIENGILKKLMNGRTPALKTRESTGSSRYLSDGTGGAFGTAPGTLHISVKDGSKPEKMKKELIKAAKEEGLDYAYIVRNSLIYKVNVKDGAETLMRDGKISRINLPQMKRALAISSKENVMDAWRMCYISLIYPSSILIEDVEISKTGQKKTKKPTLTNPSLRIATN